MRNSVYQGTLATTSDSLEVAAVDVEVVSLVIFEFLAFLKDPFRDPFVIVLGFLSKS